MRVILNVLPALKTRTGVGHYTARLAEAMAAKLGPDFHEFPAPFWRPFARVAQGVGVSGPSSHRPSLLRAAANHARGLAKSAGRVALSGGLYLSCRRHAIDLYHEPNFIPFLCDRPTVVTVHDLSALLYPQWHPARRAGEHEQFFRTLANRVAHVVTDTRFVRRQVIEHLGLPPAKVTAVPVGVGPEFAPAEPAEVARVRSQYELPGCFLLYVGTLEPRKNLITLMRAFGTLPESVRSSCPLILAGGWGWKSGEIAAHYQGEARHRGVRHIGYVSDADRPALFTAARALAYPSFYEGFGLPPLEMLACGGTVVASTAEAHREVLGRHAYYVDPLDLEGWRSALLLAATDDDWLKRARRGARRSAAAFTWDRCAAETIDVYHKATGVRRVAA